MSDTTTTHRVSAEAIIELGLHLVGSKNPERAARHLIAALHAAGYEIVKASQ